MTKADENIVKVSRIRWSLNIGDITYDEAKAELKPIIEEMNKQAEVIAKKFGKRAVKFTAAGLLR